LNETLNESQGKLTEEEYQKLKDEIYRFGTGMNKFIELEKIVKDYNSQVELLVIKFFKLYRLYKSKFIASVTKTCMLGKRLMKTPLPIKSKNRWTM